MARITVNPVFDIETGELLSHDGQYELEHVPILFDRGAVQQAKDQGKTAGATASNYGSNATSEYSSFVPGLERDANNPTGFTPIQKNDMLTQGAEAIGGVNSGIVGQANLEAARTRNAGGFSAALDEAARQKGRQASANAIGVSQADAALAQQKQQQARMALQGLYGTDTSHQLQAMGLQNQDLQTQLQGGRQGWLQNTEGVLGTVADLGKAAGSMGVKV